MSRRLLLSLAAVALLAFAAPMRSQKQPTQNPRISVDVPPRRDLVRIGVRLFASENPLCVPVCEREEGGRGILCGLATHLEQHTARGWRRARVRDASLTGRNPRLASAETIPVAGNEMFSFAFSTDIFAIPPGARLRVVVDAWPSEKSLREGAPPIQVTSPEFVCPP